MPTAPLGGGHKVRGETLQDLTARSLGLYKLEGFGGLGLRGFRAHKCVYIYIYMQNVCVHVYVYVYVYVSAYVYVYVYVYVYA